MPYRSMAAAKEAGAKTELGGAKLSLAQINAIAAVADRLKQEDKVDSPYAVAISAFKKSHKIENGRWVEKKKPEKRELSAAEEELTLYIFEAVDTGGQADDVDRSASEFVNPPGTRTVKGVEILEEGKHVDKHYHVLDVTEEKIKAIPEMFDRLADRGFRPPVRLTHDPDHPLASGFPSLGWPTRPRPWFDMKSGTWKLSSDFVGVPNVFADIMDAGGYDFVSSGLYEDVKVDDYTAPLAIDHIAVLGVVHPAITGLKGITGIHKLYENEMAARSGVSVKAAYLFEDGGIKPKGEKGGATMPEQLTQEQLASYGVSSETELKEKLATSASVDKIKKDAAIELEAARGQIRLAAADGFIARNAKKIPPALHDDFRVVHMGLAERGATVEFARPSTDGLSTETIKKDPVASLVSIVGKFGTAIELQDEKAPEGGKDQEHLTDEEKAAQKIEDDKKAAAKKAAEEKGDPDNPEEGKTDEVVELSRGGSATRTKMALDQRKLAGIIVERDKVDKGVAMSMAAVELARAGYGTDAYTPPDGLEKPPEKKDDKK